jgi:hypothetical protein
MARVFVPHNGGERNEEVAVGAIGQLGLNVGFAAPQDERANAFAEFVEVLVGLGAALIVEDVVFAVEAE